MCVFVTTWLSTSKNTFAYIRKYTSRLNHTNFLCSQFTWFCDSCYIDRRLYTSRSGRGTWFKTYCHHRNNETRWVENRFAKRFSLVSRRLFRLRRRKALAQTNNQFPKQKFHVWKKPDRFLTAPTKCAKDRAQLYIIYIYIYIHIKCNCNRASARSLVADQRVFTAGLVHRLCDTNPYKIDTQPASNVHLGRFAGSWLLSYCTKARGGGKNKLLQKKKLHMVSTGHAAA